MQSTAGERVRSTLGYRTGRRWPVDPADAGVLGADRTDQEPPPSGIGLSTTGSELFPTRSTIPSGRRCTPSQSSARAIVVSASASRTWSQITRASRKRRASYAQSRFVVTSTALRLCAQAIIARSGAASSDTS